MTERTLLGGRYETAELLGSGGMAEVRHGRDVRLGRDVAIKVLRADLATDPTFQARFRREAQSAAALNHPAIVSVYDTGEDGQGPGAVPYIVMEYVEGRTLREVLLTEGRLMPERALEITAAICSALEYSHRNGIVHRDIKPGNVMLTPSGDVKVMDFGIARAVTQSAATVTQTAAVIGTAQYLSPEQARGEHVDARSDIYSTGCLLYELLTGSPPFVGDSPVAVAYQHVRENPVPPSQVDPDIPAPVDAIVMKAMAKNPANRYQTAGEFRADIDRALAGQPVQATPLLPLETAVMAPPPPTTVLLRQQPQPSRRRRGLAYLLLALAAIVVFIVALLVAKALIGKSSTDIATPNVVGETLTQARNTLAAKGLHVGTVTYQYTGRDDSGKVLSQSPLVDILIPKGGSVSLVVSAGVQVVQVPQLVGLPEPSAASALSGQHLRLGKVTQRNQAGAAAGTVLSSDPSSGQSVPAGTPVNLVVASGNLPVPNVTGMTQADATTTLSNAGFSVSATTGDDPSQPNGLVISQSPTAGTFEGKGSTVQIVVNHLPSPSPSPSHSPSPSPSPSPSVSPLPSVSVSSST